jgi:hypothetical protein
MPSTNWLLCCWPGLPRLWSKGDWTSLAVALGFSFVLNLALIASFVWPMLLGPNFPLVAWSVVSIVWIVSFIGALIALKQTDSQTMTDAPEDGDDLFIQAQTEYLMGNWPETESLLLRRLQSFHRDIESRLMLATMFRHQRRFEEATQQLDILDRFDDTLPWQDEVHRERELLERIQLEENEDSLPDDERSDHGKASNDLLDRSPEEHLMDVTRLRVNQAA